MNPHVPEERLALYVTGDLEAGETERIYAHLEACVDCRAVAAEFGQTCSLLSGAPDEPEPETLEETRRAVLGRLQRRRNGRAWKWALGAATAAAAIALACLTAYRPEPAPIAPPAPQIAAIPPAPRQLAAAQPARIRHRVHRRPAPGIRSVALIDQPHGAPLIKIATTDPNVVILLASDERMKPE